MHFLTPNQQCQSTEGSQTLSKLGIKQIVPKTNKDQLSLTNPRDMLHHGNVLQTDKVDAQCDKLATKLS